jgi:hypothetical protein
MFVCKTNFSASINALPDHANNTPAYENTYQGPALIVSWGPKSLSVTPIKPVYYTGDVLTCSADAKPTATFVWTNLRTLVEYPPGATFTVTADLEGFNQTMHCNARNVILGSIYSGDIFTNVLVSAPVTTTTPATTTIAPADAPCDDLTGRWASTNPDSIVCLEMDSKGNLATLIRNGSDLIFVAGNGKTQYGDYKHVGFTGIWPPGEGAAGFTGECHKCSGTEVILMSGLRRNKADSPACGVSKGTTLTSLYILYRSGPPCRGLALNVAPNVKQEHLDIMGVRRA